LRLDRVVKGVGKITGPRIVVHWLRGEARRNRLVTVIHRLRPRRCGGNSGGDQRRSAGRRINRVRGIDPTLLRIGVGLTVSSRSITAGAKRRGIDNLVSQM